MRNMKVGDKIEILEHAYCGIDKARVGDICTIISQSPIHSCFWVEFDSIEGGERSMILCEHNGVGWKLYDNREEQLQAS